LMPPAGARHPDEAVADEFRQWLSLELDAAAEAAIPPPSGGLHRLNRKEYRNAVRDLLAIDVPISTLLPADDSSHGFDNMGETLRLSASLMENYLSAAKTISRLAVGSPLSAEPATYFLETESEREARAGALPFGTDGGTQVRHYFSRSGT